MTNETMRGWIKIEFVDSDGQPGTRTTTCGNACGKEFPSDGFVMTDVRHLENGGMILVLDPSDDGEQAPKQEG